MVSSTLAQPIANPCSEIILPKGDHLFDASAYAELQAVKEREYQKEYQSDLAASLEKLKKDYPKMTATSAMIAGGAKTFKPRSAAITPKEVFDYTTKQEEVTLEKMLKTVDVTMSTAERERVTDRLVNSVISKMALLDRLVKDKERGN